MFSFYVHLDESYGKTFADILEKSDSTSTANITNSETEAVKNINNTKVENYYKGPHVTLPLELQNVHKLLEYFKTGQVCYYAFTFQKKVTASVSSFFMV